MRITLINPPIDSVLENGTVSPVTAARVPTGMNAGVWIKPWAVRMQPARAGPSVAWIENVRGTRGAYPTPGQGDRARGNGRGDALAAYWRVATATGRSISPLGAVRAGQENSGSGYARIQGERKQLFDQADAEGPSPVRSNRFEAQKEDADSRLRSPLSHALHPWKCVASSR